MGTNLFNDLHPEQRLYRNDPSVTVHQNRRVGCELPKVVEQLWIQDESSLHEETNELDRLSWSEQSRKEVLVAVALYRLCEVHVLDEDVQDWILHENFVYG